VRQVEIVATTDWLPHTARAALTGLRKRGYAIARRSRGAADGSYFIATSTPLQLPAAPLAPRAPRPGTKISRVIALLSREGGTTLNDQFDFRHRKFGSGMMSASKPSSRRTDRAPTQRL
jgi:hypothetical protein